MEMTGDKWLESAEASLLSLRDVQGVSIMAEAGTIREIHVLASPGRSAKHIVRDVETCLRTRFGMGIDHRVVSVAFSKPQKAVAPGGERVPSTAAAPTAPPPPAPASAAPTPAAPPVTRAGEGAAEGTQRARAPRTADERIRFSSVNLYVSGPRVQAQVELRWKGISRMGSAAGWSTRDESFRLIAQATLAAVQEFLEETWALSLQNLEFVRLGRHDVVLVGLHLITHRHEKLLAGCCSVEQDAQQAVVLATLGAVNRVVGGLPTREPTEFVLRPASRQEESGAKKI